MSARLGLLHAWLRQVAALLPAARVTRVRGLALLALGMIWAETVRVHRVAAALPLPARVPSIERRLRRLRRFLANPRVPRRDAVAAAATGAAAALGGAGGGAGLRSHAPARRLDGAVVGIVVHRRVLPLTWRLVPQQTSWPQR